MTILATLSRTLAPRLAAAAAAGGRSIPCRAIPGILPSRRMPLVWQRNLHATTVCRQQEPEPAPKWTLLSYEQVENLSNALKGVDKEAAPVLVDVREKHEFDEGAIPGAKNIPLSRFVEFLEGTEEDFEDSFGHARPEKDKPVVFYCRSGVRSTEASEMALAHGYSTVGNFKGSYLEWSARKGV